MTPFKSFHLICVIIVSCLSTIWSQGVLTAENCDGRLTVENIEITQWEMPGSTICGIKARGTIGGSPRSVWKTIISTDLYNETMPYVKESRSFIQNDSKYLYSLLDVGIFLIQPRQYIVRLSQGVDISHCQIGIANNILSWISTPENRPEMKDGVVTVDINEGSWKVEDNRDPNTTSLTYCIHTDPGGSLSLLPGKLLTWATTKAVPDLFKAVEKAALKAP
jgi:hypothetical protein